MLSVFQPQPPNNALQPTRLRVTACAPVTSHHPPPAPAQAALLRRVAELGFVRHLAARMPYQPTPVQLVETWRQIIIGDTKSWVLFRHGTCVILMHPDTDLRIQATELMRVWGPVRVGSSAGDFSTVTLTNHPGWVVTCHHKDILTYVSPDESAPGKTDSVAIGLLGRSKRNQDSSALQIIHVEDKRTGA